jgi:hypothetical protein
MMAGLFALASAAIVAIAVKQRTLALALWAVTIILSVFMFWHHATNTLQINW